MVNFVTRTFSEEGGQVIGAEVTVYSDAGDKIGNIAITDAASIEELRQALAVIDETYFTEERLEEILSNGQENVEINATSLSGFISSDFAKVSQLSKYAPVSHNHVKSQITDLYNYQITASKYNVDIDSEVTITVKVTNQAGQPVVGVTVPVLKDNESWRSGITGVNGTFSLSYTADTWGLTTFSANTTHIQIKVDGWRTAINNEYYTCKYNDKYVSIWIHYSATSTLTTDWKDWGVITTDELRPRYSITTLSHKGEVYMRVNDSKNNLSVRAVEGTAINPSLYGHFLYKRGI